MSIDQLRQLHMARPFQPFDMHLAAARTITVEHPELLMQTPTGRTIAVARQDDAIEIIDLLLVVSLKLHANGSAKRRRR